MTNSAEKVGSNLPIQPKLKVYKPKKVVTPPTPPTVTASRISPRPPRRSLHRLTPLYRGLIWGGIFGTTAIVSATLGASLTLITPFAEKIPFAPQILPVSEKINPLPSHTLTRPLNILVLGIDQVEDSDSPSLAALRGRSDTILLLKVDPQEKSLKMLSIPRDSRVNIPRVGYTKINDANIHGGADLASEVVSQTLEDVTIDRYVRITTDVFVKLVDLVGGVEVYVPQDMYYQDRTQNLYIDLKAGLQTLNGQQAEEFARFRSQDSGDVGRVQRQQILLKALQKKLSSPAILPRLPQVLSLLQTNIDTNLSWEEMLGLANLGRDLSVDDVQMVMLPGRFSLPHEYDGRSYWLLDRKQKEIKQIMATYFGVGTTEIRDRSPSPYRIRIALQNTTNDPSLTRTVRKYLAQHNYTNVYILEDSRQILETSEVVVQQGDLNSAQLLQTTLGIGKVEASSTGDLGSDLTLRIGLDAKRLNFGESFLKSVH
ncbi:MAG: LCP family protein [Microcystaceae cyanobacterium]